MPLLSEEAKRADCSTEVCTLLVVVEKGDTDVSQHKRLAEAIAAATQQGNAYQKLYGSTHHHKGRPSLICTGVHDVHLQGRRAHQYHSSQPAVHAHSSQTRELQAAHAL